MKYLKISREDGTVTEITKEHARWLMKGAYRYREEAIDELLNMPGTIPLMFSLLEISEE